MLNIIALVGSPRKNKNNDSLVNNMLKGIQDTCHNEIHMEKLYIRDLDIKPCMACAACARKAGCIIEDDMSQIYDKFNRADIVIISSPLYFNSISGALKTLVDRNQAIWSSKYILNQPIIDRQKKRLGYFICTAGMPESEDLFDATLPIMDLFFKSINTQWVGNLFIGDMDRKPIINNRELLKEAYDIGSWLAKNI